MAGQLNIHSWLHYITLIDTSHAFSKKYHFKNYRIAVTMFKVSGIWSKIIENYEHNYRSYSSWCLHTYQHFVSIISFDIQVPVLATVLSSEIVVSPSLKSVNSSCCLCSVIVRNCEVTLEGSACFLMFQDCKKI